MSTRCVWSFSIVQHSSCTWLAAEIAVAPQCLQTPPGFQFIFSCCASLCVRAGADVDARARTVSARWGWNWFSAQTRWPAAVPVTILQAGFSLGLCGARCGRPNCAEHQGPIRFSWRAVLLSRRNAALFFLRGARSRVSRPAGCNRNRAARLVTMDDQDRPQSPARALPLGGSPDLGARHEGRAAAS